MWDMMPKYCLMTRRVYLKVSLTKCLTNRIKTTSELCSIHENYFCDVDCNFEQRSEIIKMTTYQTCSQLRPPGFTVLKETLTRVSIPCCLRGKCISDIITFRFHPFHPSIVDLTRTPSSQIIQLQALQVIADVTKTQERKNEKKRGFIEQINWWYSED